MHSCRGKGSPPPSRGRLAFPSAAQSVMSNAPIFMNTILTVTSLNEIKRLMNLGRILLSKDAQLVFVCGASLDTNDGKNARNRFIEYAAKHLDEYDVFIAEDFFKLFKNPDDLLTIENELGSYSDCIIIFLESDSAIAELGAFSNNNDLAKQILVINNEKYRTKPSFITNGPLAKIGKISKYGSTIYCDLNSVLSSVGEIKKRLDNEKNRYNKGINIASYENYRKLSRKNKMLLLLDFITLLQPINYTELLLIHKSIIGEGSYHIEFDINLLSALGYIREIDGFYIKEKRYTKLFHVFSYSKSVVKLRSYIMNQYHKKDITRINKYNEYLRMQ